MQIKVLVVYLCMGLVSLILGTIAVRAVVAFTTWLLAGRALWLLPNALSDVRRFLIRLCAWNNVSAATWQVLPAR